MSSIAPKLRFPEFSDEWKVKKLGDFSKTFSGGTPTSSKKSYYTGNIPFIKSGEIKSDETGQFISDDAYKSSSAKMVNKGDILYALYGATSGQVAISKITGAINQAILCIRPEANNYFIYSKLLRDKDDILNTYIQGGQGNLSADIIKNLHIGLPGGTEQQKIADFLTAVDVKIAMIDKKVNLLKKYKKSVMQKIFSQQIRFRDKNGNSYPDWQNHSSSYLFDIKKGEQLNRDTLTEFGEYPVINGGIIASGYANTYNTSGNTITISEGGNSCGYVSYIKQNFWSGGHCYTVTPKNGFIKTYTYYLLKNNEENIKRLRVGSGLPNIQKTDILKYKVNISKNKNEQQKIADLLTSLDDKINLKEKELEQARHFKKALLQRMFA